jgi:hypothetical protein
MSIKGNVGPDKAIPEFKQLGKHYVVKGMNIPELKKLGKNFFPKMSVADFWEMLLWMLGNEVYGDEDDSWQALEEEIGKSVPAGFRKIHQKPMKLWKAIECVNIGSVTWGVLRHLPSGLCRPIQINMEGCFIGPALPKFTAKAGAQAALKMLELQCKQFGSPCAEITNYVPHLISREQIMAAYRLGWLDEKASLVAHFDESYSEP